MHQQEDKEHRKITLGRLPVASRPSSQIPFIRRVIRPETFRIFLLHHFLFFRLALVPAVVISFRQIQLK